MVSLTLIHHLQISNSILSSMGCLCHTKMPYKDFKIFASLICDVSLVVLFYLGYRRWNKLLLRKLCWHLVVKYRTKVLFPDWLKVHKKSPGVPAFGGMFLGHGSTGCAPEAREGEQACWLPLGTTGEAFGGLPLSIGTWGLSIGHGSTGCAPLTCVNRARKPMGHVTLV